MRPFFGVLAALALAGTALGNCGSAYFPVQQGWVWTYRSSVDNQTYTQTHTNVSASGFTNVIALSSGTVRAKWRCDAGGVVALEQNGASFSGAASQIEMETVNVRGVQVPRSLAMGSTWTFAYTMRAKLPEGQGSMTSEVQVSNKVVGRESVKVWAGTFTAFKVQSIMTMKMTMSVAGQNRPMPAQTINSTSWYASGVGVVKSVSGDITTELVSLKK